MAKKTSNPQYFKYQDYDAIKKSFVYEPREKIDVSFANYLINSIHNTRDNELNLRKTFCELKKLVQRGECFYHHGIDSCCNYINYWLNKTVRESDYRVNEKNFENFDEFMRVDPKVGKSSINCISKLSYMDTDVFQKTKKLYDLYDYFTKLKEHEVSSTLCHNISHLAKEYESIMQEYEKDNKLCKELTNLRNVIEKDKLVANDRCTRNTFDSFILKRHPPPLKEPTAPKRVQVPVQSRNSVKAHTRHTVSVPSQQAHGKHPGEKPIPPHVTVSSSPALGRNSVQTPTPTPVSVSLSQAKGLEKQARVESERTSSEPSEQFPLPLPRPLLPLGQSGPLESPETEEAEEYGRPKGLQEPEQPQVQLQEEDQVHRLKDDVDTFREDGEGTFLQEVDPSADSMQSTFNTETIMETIKGAVSNVLEAVEPVPILGVSGGMGALYLLLKYTPIGSLLGRNRRNNQNIPNFFDPEYGEQYSDYYPEYYNEDFPSNRMNIAYHPSSDALD